jgi:hypothetical protein
VSNGPGDEALSWDGDDDPTLEPRMEPARAAKAMRPPKAPRPERTARPAHAAAPATAGAEVDAAGDQPAVLGNVALVALGLIAGAYLFFAVGWLIAGLRLQVLSGVLVSPVMYTAGVWGAALAPVVWFVAALALTRRSRAWVRFSWLIAGIVLLVPWPFLQTGAVA